jgi:SAM-dependent methyltransferase
MDVDVLCDAGFDCVGIDCGNRTAAWPRRVEKKRFLLANGQNLPFEDRSFDGIFCGCVFPHVGVIGDSYRVGSHYRKQRLQLAREMSRVLRPEGKILVSSPNRLFPFDIFHGRTPGSYRPRPYWPGDPFLLSLADYRSLFSACGLSKAEPLPVAGYWSFFRSRRSWKGYLLGLPIRSAFWLASRPELSAIRCSPMNPWIVVLVEKAEETDR